MTTIPKDIDKWDNNKWTQQVVNCRPSSGGAVGVVFVWAGMAYSRQNVQDARRAAFVIKPIQGSAAPTKFAEHVLSKISGAVSPNSKPIPRRSPSGSGLVLTLKMFRDKEADANVKARWQQVFQHYDRADAFLIQETQTGIKEFGDEYREQSGLALMLLNTDLMTNLGKLFAADALIGNGDRLSKLNTGNIIFKSDGTLCSIDTTTILTDFNSIVADHQMGIYFTPDGSALNAKNWAANDIVKFGSTQAASPMQQQQFGKRQIVLAPSAAVETIFNVDLWWINEFRSHLESEIQKLAPPLPSPPETVWNHAKMCFKRGVEQGINQIDVKLSGLNWMMMKNKYKNFVSRYGGDPNLDWMNFKIRRRYIKLRKKGYTDEQALKDVQDYVARKMPGL
ncbi:MAG TPA: hypothetical protein VF692_10090 [Pyrinomonadaceae bacterium]|jgi:hypothetical protein